MAHFTGSIIEESLVDTSVLEKVKIVSTRVEAVTDRHKTPWLEKWTIDEVHIPITQAKTVAAELSHSFDVSHSNTWYADFKNKLYHYVIFPGRVFCIDRSNEEQYNSAQQYGASLRIPSYMLDFDKREEEEN